MTIEIPLAGTQTLRVRIFDRDGEPEVDWWDLYEGDKLLESPGPEMERWIEAEFSRFGIDAFSLRALYEQLRREGDAA